jgi:hypothetical protein
MSIDATRTFLRAKPVSIESSASSDRRNSTAPITTTSETLT